ncbi:MAG: hypothetical protein PHU22_09980 [Eubacteriales bacterium]|nr:hypothetical protein [Eubacteriales bacterium]
MHIKKRFWFKLLIALLAMAFFCLHTYATVEDSATAYLALNYEKASKGLYPNGTRFNMYDIINEDIAAEAIRLAGLEDELSPLELMDSLSVSPRYTRSVYEEYIGTEYVITLYLDKKLSHINADNLLMMVCKAYSSKFEQSFVTNDMLSGYRLPDTESYDYPQITQLIATRISLVNDFLTRRNRENGTFRSETTNETFAALIAQLDNLQSVLLEKYRAFITENGLTKNYELYTAELGYKQFILSNDYNKSYLQYTVRMNAIDIYDTKQTAIVMIPTYDTSSAFYMSKTKIGMDYMAEDAESYMSYAQDVNKSLLTNQHILSQLGDAQKSLAALASRRMTADTMIKNMNGILSGIIDSTIKTDDDYIRYTLYGALSFRPARYTDSENYSVQTGAILFVIVFLLLTYIISVLESIGRKTRDARLSKDLRA